VTSLMDTIVVEPRLSRNELLRDGGDSSSQLELSQRRCYPPSLECLGDSTSDEQIVIRTMWDDLRVELGWIRARCRRRLRSAFTLSLAFKALNLLLLAPLATIVLRLCLTRWGRASVGNFELVSFLLSPVGIAALFGVGSVLLASLYLELAGMLRLLADDGLHWWQAFQSSTRLLLHLVQLGLRQLAVYLALVAPFLAGIGVVYWLLWSGKDLNGLIILKPPAFWWGVVAAGVLAAAYIVLALWVFFRRFYAVPILVFEPGTSISAAIRESIERSRGTVGRCAAAIAIWAALVSLAAVTTHGLVQVVLQSLMRLTGSSLALAVLVTGTALIIHAVVATIVSVLGNLSFTAVLLSLYRRVAPPGALDQKTAAAGPRNAAIGWMLGFALPAAAALSAVLSAAAICGQKLHEVVEITAHRAGAAGAPENTVAALKQAIADQADWAELDVQLTSDKAIIVLHDIDLARVGGGSRRVDQATFSEVREFDVGTASGPQFAGERIPTLEEFLAAADERIRLNVELKPHSKQDGDELTRRVIEEIRGAKMVGRCRLCSQSYESLQLARQLEPRLEVGYIAATAVGDLTRLEVNFLMVKSSLATRELADRARLRNIAVHAWTVNDSADVGPLLDAGVTNLITDDPARIRAQVEEINALTTIQRLLLRARHALVR
jgi:glycerophosphoryl diester phosphodiesterase